MDAMRQMAALAAFAVVFAGCKSGPPTTLKVLEPEAPAGWRIFDRSEHGFTIAAPLNWTVHPPSAVRMDAFGATVDDPDPGPPPEVPKDLTQEERDRLAKLEEKDIYLKLYDNQQRPLPGEIMTSMIVERQSGASNIDNEVKDYVSKTGAKPEEHKRIELPIGPAEEFKFNSTDIKGDVSYRIEYLIAHKDNLYVIKLVAMNTEGLISQVALPMAQSFRVRQ